MGDDKSTSTTLRSHYQLSPAFHTSGAPPPSTMPPPVVRPCSPRLRLPWMGMGTFP